MKYRTNSILIFIIMFCCIISGCQKDVNTTEKVDNTKTAADTSMEQDEGKASQDRYTKISFSSKALNKEMKVNVYLPEGYSEKLEYPVLYLIHGYTGNEDTWIPGLETEKKADELIEKKEIEPLIIVAPQIDNSYGINSTKVPVERGIPSTYFNTGLYEDYLCKELIPYIDKNYSTISAKEGRYVGGLSMGGWVALHLAFTYTDMFSKVGGHSPAIFLDGYSGSAMSFVYPTEELRNGRDPLRVAQDKDLTGLKVYLDCGDEDSYQFYEGCEKLNTILRSKGVDSQYHLNKGNHDGTYWGANIENYLKFYGGK
ncbi:enterochelin esterase-like enzyme [Ruminiclostridium sufflavum DSM 19573]|uniref:Enterochelin esterase-like enzyme n=1 Tax=Ruminiclostridium sufflavum DSM 19573 TaxID=1121337 RepID=A0A318Y5T0_9FIRM|nr:alpha/beta hydrolase-fold protein [Ruminiclostridium sufflavum]PYG87336.1 enterochelin esterase-like enzyme [Ruminiclostridium sufflavum DSM 19573]